MSAIRVTLNSERFRREKRQQAEKSRFVEHLSSVWIWIGLSSFVVVFSVMLYNSVIREGYYGIGQIVKAMLANFTFCVGMWILIRQGWKALTGYSEEKIAKALRGMYIKNVPTSIRERIVEFNERGISVNDTFCIGAVNSYHPIDWSDLTGVVQCGEKFIALYIDPDLMSKNSLNEGSWFKGLILQDVFDGLEASKIMEVCKEYSGLPDDKFLEFPADKENSVLMYMYRSADVDELESHREDIMNSWFDDIVKDGAGATDGSTLGFTICNGSSEEGMSDMEWTDDVVDDFDKRKVNPKIFDDNFMTELYTKWTGTKEEFEAYYKGTGELPKDMRIVDGKIEIITDPEKVLDDSPSTDSTESTEKSSVPESSELETYKFENK